MLGVGEQEAFTSRADGSIRPPGQEVLGVSRLCRGSCGATLLKALAAEDRAALSWLERDSGVFAAAGTGCAGLDLLIVRGGIRAHCGRALGLARLAALGLIFELLIVEEELFTGGEQKLRTAVHTL